MHCFHLTKIFKALETSGRLMVPSAWEVSEPFIEESSLLMGVCVSQNHHVITLASDGNGTI